MTDVNNDDVDWFLRDLKQPKQSDSVTNTPDGSGGITTKKSDDSNHKNDSTTNDNNDSNTGGGTSPHLGTVISNSNDHVISKTKPTIETIKEEVTSPTHRRNSVASLGPGSGHSATSGSMSAFGPSLTRKRTNSVSSINSNGSSSGFFGKLKGKFHKSPPNSPVIQPIFKDNYNMNLRNTTGNDFSLSKTLSNTAPVSGSSLSSFASDDDPKLHEYIEYYKKVGSISSSRKSSMSEGCLMNHDAPNPVPGANLTGSVGKLGFLRRRQQSVPTTSIATHYNRRTSETSLTPIASNSNSTTNSVVTEDTNPLAEFRNIKPLKRVAFHSSTFLIDPPQQIPSRSPRKGNVEVLENGSLKINPLSEEDRLAMEKSAMGQGGGIVVGGTGSLHYLKPNDAKANPNDKEQVGEEEEEEEEESDEPVSDHTKIDTSQTSLDEKIDKHASQLGIDKPMFHNRGNNYTVPIEKMALDLMYTRCCHLREILPIPAILKQIPKDSMAPITNLQLRNPTPTLIEIQTFADFIRIAPIICISLDGVQLSFEQFRIILSAMGAKTQLEKLSLRNTPISPEGWSLLCWFLSKNKSLSRLDITQCPSLSINILKKRKVDKSKKKDEEIVRMTCNKENRSDMDWCLFIATIIARGGIEELILTGCCILDLNSFEKLIKLAVGIRTHRLGLAYNNLTIQHTRILMDHWLFKPFVKGIDIGYNDFSSNEFATVIKEISAKQPEKWAKQLEESQIAFLSFNSCNLRFTKKFKFIFEEFILKLPNLKYLDLSNNPKLFEGNSKGPFNKLSESDDEQSYFTSSIPLLSQLIRLHLENNCLTTNQVLALANILPFCKNLRYVSLIGNKIDSVCAAALVQSCKNSKKLITLEADLDDVPAFFKERLSLYTMRNMERSMYPNKETGVSNDSDVLTNQFYEILEMKAKGKLDLNSGIVKNFLNQAKQMKAELNESVNELNQLRLQKILTLEGKEALLRLMFIDSSIGKAIKMIDENFNDHEKENLSLSESTTHKEMVDDDEYVDEAPKLNNQIKSPGMISRTSSKTSLNQIEKGEGTLLKLGHTMRDEEGLFDNLSGEEIRKKIASVSFDQLTEIIKFVKILKERGIVVSNVFKDQKHEKDLDINYIADKLRTLSSNKADDVNESIHEKTSDSTSDSDDTKDSEAETNKSGVQIQINDRDDRYDDKLKHQAATPMASDYSYQVNGTGEMNELFDEVLHNYTNIK